MQVKGAAEDKKISQALHGVTGNFRCRLGVESSPAKRHTPTLRDPLLLPRLQNCNSSFPKEIVRSSCDSSMLANAESS